MKNYSASQFQDGSSLFFVALKLLNFMLSFYNETQCGKNIWKPKDDADKKVEEEVDKEVDKEVEKCLHQGW